LEVGSTEEFGADELLTDCPCDLEV
jgi:hypothetical protein